MRVLVTGASGFVGSVLCSTLVARGHAVTAVIRLAGAKLPSADITVMAIGEIDELADWSSVLNGVDCVVHCAARVPAMHESEIDPLTAYRRVNVAGTRRLAEQASALGVRRLVFLSSIKVTSELRTLEASVVVSDPSATEDPYGLSKWEAEKALWAVSAKTGLEVVVVRPPLVYGPGVKGNFARLLALVRSGVPLPMANVNNRRTFIGIDNLVDFLITCIDHPSAAGQTLLVSDGRDLSTPELLRMIARAMKRPVRLFSVPVPLIRLIGRVIGRSIEVERLVSSLWVNSVPSHELLGWKPPLSAEEGISRMIEGILDSDSLP